MYPTLKEYIPKGRLLTSPEAEGGNYEKSVGFQIHPPSNTPLQMCLPQSWKLVLESPPSALLISVLFPMVSNCEESPCVYGQKAQGATHQANHCFPAPVALAGHDNTW